MMTFRQQLYNALIDSGSELFFVNAELAQEAEALGYPDISQPVHLASSPGE